MRAPFLGERKGFSALRTSPGQPGWGRREETEAASLPMRLSCWCSCGVLSRFGGTVPHHASAFSASRHPGVGRGHLVSETKEVTSLQELQRCLLRCGQGAGLGVPDPIPGMLQGWGTGRGWGRGRLCCTHTSGSHHHDLFGRPEPFQGWGPPTQVAGGNTAESLRELLGAFRSPPASAHALPFPGL